MDNTNNNNNNKAEPFPALEPVQSSNEIQPPARASTAPISSTSRHRTSTRSRKTRTASLLQNLFESSPPLGAWQAISEDTAKGPTIPEIKNGSYNLDGWSHEGQLEQRNVPPAEIHARRVTRTSMSSGSRTRHTTSDKQIAPTLSEEPLTDDQQQQPFDHPAGGSLQTSKDCPSVAEKTIQSQGPDNDGVYPNGYRFPRKHTWKLSFAIYGAAFWKSFWTIKGFLLTIYALNVVAWGAMIFFLLIPGATPAMCKAHGCDNKRYSSRQIWIENCSQILTALFCVTAFGLLPWRLRDFYYMLRYQSGDHSAVRKLAGFYSSWYRLEGSEVLPEHLGRPPKPEDLKVNMFGKVKGEVDEELEMELSALEANPAIPLPPWSMPDAPLTGVRARPTRFRQLAIMIWCYLMNSVVQVGLCVVMWGFNRFQRDHAYFSALTALFIILGCFTGAAGGIVAGREQKVIKNTEGIPVKDYDTLETGEDYRQRKALEDKKREKKEAKARKKRKDVEKDAASS